MSPPSSTSGSGSSSKRFPCDARPLLPAVTSVREKLIDPAYANWFLKFDCNKSTGCHVPTDGTPFCKHRIPSLSLAASVSRSQRDRSAQTTTAYRPHSWGMARTLGVECRAAR